MTSKPTCSITPPSSHLRPPAPQIRVLSRHCARYKLIYYYYYYHYYYY